MIDGLVCACRGANITAINEAGLRLLGYRGQGTPVGSPLHRHVAGPWAKKLKRNLAALAQGKQPKMLTLLSFDGRDIAVDLSARKTKDGMLIVATPDPAMAIKAARVLSNDATFQRLTDHGPEAVCLVEVGRVLHINRAARAFLSMTDARDVIGKPFADFIHSEHVARFKAGHKALAKLEGRAAPEAVKLKDVHGQVRDVELWVRALGPKGPLAVLLRDVTQRLIAVENLRAEGLRLQAIVDAVADGVIAVDERGLVQSVNAAVRRLFGFAPKQLIGKPLTKILPHWTDETGVVVTMSVMGSDSIEFPAQLLGKTRDMDGVRHDKTTFPAEITVTTMQDGSGSLFTVVVRDAGARKAAEEAQRSYAEKLSSEVAARTREIQDLSRQSRQILESASDGIIAVGLDGQIKTANPAAGELFDRSHVAMTGLPVERVFLYGSGHLNAGRPAPIKAQMADGPFHADIEVSLARTDGSSFDAAYVISPISEARQVSGYVITVRDITERKKIAAEQRVASAVFDQSADGLLVADARGRVLKVNPAFTRLTESTASALIGQPMNEAMQAEPKLYREALEALQKKEHTEWEQWLGEQWVGEKWVGGKRAADKSAGPAGDRPGKRQAWRIGLSMIRDEQGRAQQYAAIVSDVTSRKLEEERILYQANYDQLTGLPNRTLFNDRLQRVVLEGRRGKTNVGLMFIDLDGFKAINDTLGHDAGDLLLKATAERLNKSVRESDTVARLGGDEFTVIMPLLDSFDGATLVANRILKSLTTPFDLNGQEGRVSASIGISMFPAQCSDAQQLLHNADVAMYHAKRHGKANFQIWRQELEVGAEARY